MLLMLPKVVVGAVCDPLQLAPAERELVLDVRRHLRVMRALLVTVIPKAQPLGADPEHISVPAHSLVLPMVEPPLVVARLDEELHLHLLEFALPENELPCRDLVPETESLLGDSKRHSHAHRVDHVLEVDEHSLRRLRKQVGAGG